MAEALIEMSRKGFGVVGVVDAAGALVGIVTDGDLRRHMDGLLERRVEAVMTRGAAHDRDDGAGLGGARGDERAEDHHALRHRAGGAGAAGGHPARARLPARRRRLSRWRRARGCIRGSSPILKVGLPLVALGLLSALFLVQTEDRLGGGIVFSPGDIDGARQRAADHATRPSPAPPAARTASASPPSWWCRTRRRRSGRRSPRSRARSRCTAGRRSTVERGRPASSTSRPSGST